MSPQLEELVVEYALAALEKQMRFDAWLGGHSWEWNRQTGLLTLRREKADTAFVCATQALGSVSRMSETWTWIWANDLAEVGDDLTQAARQLRALGEEKQVPELAVGEFSRAQVNAHVLSLVSMSICGADAYFRGAYLGGEGFVLINRGELRELLQTKPFDATEVCEIVRAVDALCENHHRAVVGYLQRSGWQIKNQGDSMLAKSGDEQICVVFDGQRLISAEVIAARLAL